MKACRDCQRGYLHACKSLGVGSREDRCLKILGFYIDGVALACTFGQYPAVLDGGDSFHYELVSIGITAHHIHAHHKLYLVDAHQGIQEFGQVGRAVQAYFLGVECRDYDAAFQIFAVSREFTGNLDEGGAAGSVVIRSWIYLPALFAQMVVVSPEHYVLVFELPSFDEGHDIGILLSVTLERHQKVAAAQRLEPALLVARNYVVASLGRIGASRRTPVKRVGCKVINVISEPFASCLGEGASGPQQEREQQQYYLLHFQLVHNPAAAARDWRF